MSTWTWFSSKRERRVILKSLDHIGTVIEVINHLDSMVNFLQKLDYENALKEYTLVNQKEEEADRIKRDLIEELSRGTIHPMDREDLLRLILGNDDIAAYAKASARRLKLMIELKYELPDTLISVIKNIIENIKRSVEHIKDSINYLISDPCEAIKLSHVIEELEERVDDLRMEALRYIYKLCNEKEACNCLLYKELIDDLEMTADKCEDVSDIIRSIAISHT
ncbi:MAG: phosphate transport regulator [Desulfurococcales archaeon ex4484_58]|nr:MAG: phosphate transport regulator [Desulfurococcales archaeon ex4484_58]